MIGAAARSLLNRLDPETAHRLAIAGLKTGVRAVRAAPGDRRLAVKAAGLDFPNPLGMAAGFDKNAEVPDALLRLGFGFVEVGTLTPLPQDGNPRPRIFRLPRDGAVINRLGFNNDGHDAAERRLAGRRRGKGGVLGVNVGANKDSADRIADYQAGVRRFARHASYLAINISSPNTAGLRDLQGRRQLGQLLSRVVDARDEAAGQRRVPLFLKIAPDLDGAALEDIAAEVADKRIEGVIVSNTTLARPDLIDARRSSEAGGLSGRPLFEPSTAVLARMRLLLGPEIALIGVGGVHSAETALEKIRAGADVVQFYTGMIFAGPGLPSDILAGLIAFMDRAGLSSLRTLRDSRTEEWAARCT